MILRCEGLNKSFDGTRALAGVSVEFPSSGIIAIIGPNGAGKTTLINVLTGFLRADSGRSFLGERELTGFAPHKLHVSVSGEHFKTFVSSAWFPSSKTCCSRARTKKASAYCRAASIRRRNRRKAESRRGHALVEICWTGGRGGTTAGELSYGQQNF